MNSGLRLGFFFRDFSLVLDFHCRLHFCLRIRQALFEIAQTLSESLAEFRQLLGSKQHERQRKNYGYFTGTYVKHGQSSIFAVSAALRSADLLLPNPNMNERPVLSAVSKETPCRHLCFQLLPWRLPSLALSPALNLAFPARPWTGRQWAYIPKARNQEET